MSWWKPLAKIGAGLVGGIGGFLIGGPVGAAAGFSLGYGITDSVIGAVDQQQAAQEAASDLADQKTLTQQQQAMERDQALKQADIAAKQGEINAKNIGEESRAAEIDKFKQESAALASSGSSGIAEGSPYLAAESSINEMGRRINTWFNNSVAGQGFAGQQTAMMLEGSRFNDRAADVNIRKIDRAKDDAEEAASGWNFALNLAGGILSSVANAYSFATTVGAMDMTAKAMGGYKEFFSNGNFLKAGAALKYGQMTGDMSFFANQAGGGGVGGADAVSGAGMRAPTQPKLYSPYSNQMPGIRSEALAFHGQGPNPSKYAGVSAIGASDRFQIVAPRSPMQSLTGSGGYFDLHLNKSRVRSSDPMNLYKTRTFR